ncbi:uncharacterized protein LY89DRAFT_110 [Mollisia scopiformis]|uniref:Uncharacterized protein n=1 Tax=Mollisia scopiformis TaxID=149040 RepID=A0A194XTM5_MOLSC|nr:uncharacterized protein LY89DRAFT_110 [Mollisia scopiformis]KUJ23670.1 hypothetical protein LY89DRAFT_110 [Mollisia scopiformis]
MLSFSGVYLSRQLFVTFPCILNISNRLKLKLKLKLKLTLLHRCSLYLTCTPHHLSVSCHVQTSRISQFVASVLQVFKQSTDSHNQLNGTLMHPISTPPLPIALSWVSQHVSDAASSMMAASKTCLALALAHRVFTARMADGGVTALSDGTCNCTCTQGIRERPLLTFTHSRES